MENTTMSMKEQVMSMMHNHLEMLELEFNDAERALGRSANEKEHNRTNENYSDYYDKNMAYDICKEKMQLMKKMTEKIGAIFDSQVPMLAKI